MIFQTSCYSNINKFRNITILCLILESLNPDTHIALITDINCQDGSYLAELLIENGYEVYGISPSSYYTIRYHNIGHIIKNLRIITGDCCDTNFINRTIKTIMSKYPYIESFHIYDFDIQSDVGLSFDIPQETMERNIRGTHNLLECIRNIEMPFRNKIKIFHASSSEIFGHGENENLLKILKLLSYHMVAVKRRHITLLNFIVILMM